MATFLINRSPTPTNFRIPPESSFTRKPANLENLRVFGCMAHLHIPEGERKKLDKRSHMCMFIGMMHSQKPTGYMITLERKLS